MFIKDRVKVTRFNDLKIGDHFEYKDRLCIRIDSSVNNKYNCVSLNANFYDLGGATLIKRVRLIKDQEGENFTSLNNGDVFLKNCEIWMKIYSPENLINAVNLKNGSTTFFSIDDRVEKLSNAFLDLNNERV